MLKGRQTRRKGGKDRERLRSLVWVDAHAEMQSLKGTSTRGRHQILVADRQGNDVDDGKTSKST
jgi:hypothetical protein